MQRYGIRHSGPESSVATGGCKVSDELECPSNLTSYNWGIAAAHERSAVTAAGPSGTDKIRLAATLQTFVRHFPSRPSTPQPSPSNRHDARARRHDLVSRHLHIVGSDVGQARPTTGRGDQPSKRPTHGKDSAVSESIQERKHAGRSPGTVTS